MIYLSLVTHPKEKRKNCNCCGSEHGDSLYFKVIGEDFLCISCILFFDKVFDMLGFTDE